MHSPSPVLLTRILSITTNYNRLEYSENGVIFYNYESQFNDYLLFQGVKMKKHEELETPTFTTSLPNGIEA